MLKSLTLVATSMSLAALVQPAAAARDADAVTDLARIIEAEFYDEARAHEIADDLRSDAATGAFDAYRSPDALASALTDRLSAIDRHFSVRYVGPDAVAERTRPDDGTAENPADRPADPWAALRRQNFGFADVGILPGNIGYIDLRQFAPIQPAEETARAALEFIANTDAVIIDVRQNIGGAPSMVQYLISHFLDPEEPVVINTFVSRNLDYPNQLWSLPVHPAGNRPDVPLVVLTSRNSGSAGEAFPYHLQAMERATIIGERTYGAGNPGGTFFTDDGYAIFVSTGSARNPITGTNWEGDGVAPDIAVPAGEALETAELYLYDQLLDRDDLDPAARQAAEWGRELVAARRTPVEIDGDTLQRFAGTYGNRAFTVEDGRLVYTRAGGTPSVLLPVGRNRFAIPGNHRYRFVFDTGGRGSAPAVDMHIAGQGQRTFPRTR
ncbi:MAG: S41 family peptidase [Pseudomonadota bacterium]|nr:S41 family peptidase [Pseudomonadota bacterium]